MYIYERKLSESRFLPSQGINGFRQLVGSSGSYLSEASPVAKPRLEPFVNQPYGPEMVFDPARTKDLTTAIATARTKLSLRDQLRLDKAAFTIAKLTTGYDPVPYAGVKQNDMLFSASLLKLTLLYASFELVARVNDLATAFLPGGSPIDFMANVQRAFESSIVTAVPSIPDGPWRKLNFKETLVPTRGGSGVYTVDLSPVHSSNLETIVADQLQDWAARACMGRLGYSYVNGALAAGGFFDAKTKNGIWYANDLGGGWRQFYVPVATGGKSSAAMTTLAMARLLTSMHRGTLVDQASSKKMKDIMAKGGAWITMKKVADQAGPLSFVSKGGKVGHFPSADARVSSVKSEGAFLDRNGVPFVAVWQNYPDASPEKVEDVSTIYRVIDEVVRKWP